MCGANIKDNQQFLQKTKTTNNQTTQPNAIANFVLQIYNHNQRKTKMRPDTRVLSKLTYF